MPEDFERRQDEYDNRYDALAMTGGPINEAGYFSIQKAIFRGQVWRLITFQFLHASPTHLAMNMIWLFLFGQIVEGQFGPRRYLAFYLLFSSLLFVAWCFIILGTDRSTYWEFAPNSIAKKYWFTDAAESYTSPQVETARQSDDVFVHRLLGLWFLGFGTGDIEIRFRTAGSGQKVFYLKNVWRAARVEREINRLVA